MAGLDISLPDEALRRIEYKAYHLRSYEISSISEISSMLHNGSYLERETVHEHIIYLQDLVERLNTIIHTQSTMGENSPRLVTEIRRIKRILEELYTMESHLPSKYVVS